MEIIQGGPPPLMIKLNLFSSMAPALFLILLLLPLNLLLVSATPANNALVVFSPQDNYLIDCGSSTATTLPDGRTFLSDSDAAKFYSSNNEDILVNVPSAENVTSPLFLSAKVFTSESTYSFHIARVGWHWIRLHFYPLDNKDHNLAAARFSVVTDTIVLLHDFTFNSEKSTLIREYIINLDTERFSIKFRPKDGIAFVNAIEVVSAPDILIPDTASTLFPISEFAGLSEQSFQTVYRLNVGGPLITPQNDTLDRTWVPDTEFLETKEMASTVNVATNVIKYPQGESPLIAPQYVYATAVVMANANMANPNFNVTWNLNVDTSFDVLVRLHFADILSKALNDLYFNVYINGRVAISGLDLSTVTGDLASAYYKDFVFNASMAMNPMKIQIGPFDQSTGQKNAIINGIEVFKINNSMGSLDGEFDVNGRSMNGGSKGTVAAVGFAMMFGAFVGLGAMAVKWQKRPHDWQKRNSFSSWLLPLHAGDTSFMASKYGSRKSQFFSSTNGLGRWFSFAELSDATKNWETVIGVGGFGNVYIGAIDEGTQVAVKRGNPQSEQGINEFQTEIQMLSKLRHRHLVSLIGYCDENSEMILVYEFMSKGPLRDHLYGKNLPPLSWKQRLECCIGAARGLHYLHTGTQQGIIHRDVKTTNILLDDNLVAKMADFGLSKDGPTTDNNYVSTAVKGSFGYLDPEYFRKQQLTDKSDVYSFGVVMLEVICARPALNPQLPREQVNLAEWAMQWKRKGMLEKIVDPNLQGNVNPESMKKFAEAAEKCLEEYGVDRPTMGDVLWNMEYALQLQDQSSSKEDDENKETSAPAAAPAAEGATKPAETQAVDEHSGSAVFNQLTDGR